MMPIYRSNSRARQPSMISKPITYLVYILSLAIVFFTAVNIGDGSVVIPRSKKVEIHPPDLKITETQQTVEAQEIKPPVVRPPALPRATAVRERKIIPSGIYQLSVEGIDGGSVNLASYAGNVSLVINVASKCGYTEANYKHLQPLYEKYRERGFTILAFPCDEFGRQEPGTNQEIKSWAFETYGVTFPLFGKTSVNGETTNDVFKYLKSHTPSTMWGGGKTITGEPEYGNLLWNFQKWVVDRRGEPRFFYYQTFDDDRRVTIEQNIEQLLAEAVPFETVIEAESL